MKSFSDSIIEYKKQLDNGDIQIAYRGLLEYMMGLKNFFKNKYPDFSVPSGLYQGYMDMTYFALFPEDLKRRKLKIAIVLIHDKMKLEIWLSGINKQIQTKYWNILKSKDLNVYQLPKTLKGADSIIEYVLTDNPDFIDPEALTRQIESGTLKFIKDIKELIKDN
jgi:hypothetical protein